MKTMDWGGGKGWVPYIIHFVVFFFPFFKQDLRSRVPSLANPDFYTASFHSFCNNKPIGASPGRE
jgi:hypothetical protein